MTAELVPVSPQSIPVVPWRDPHTVSPEKLANHIRLLENASLDNPNSPGIHTCLGMAYAMNFEVYKSMDALEAAIEIEPGYFFAHLKYGELHYRLRALIRAEQETLKALDLAANPWEFAMARHLLQEIRTKMREGTQKPEWTKPLAHPAVCLIAVTTILCLAVYLK